MRMNHRIKTVGVLKLVVKESLQEPCPAAAYGSWIRLKYSPWESTGLIIFFSQYTVGTANLKN